MLELNKIEKAHFQNKMKPLFYYLLYSCQSLMGTQMTKQLFASVFP